MKKSSNSLRIGLAVAVIIGTIGWLAFTGYGANKSYYVTIAELHGLGDKAYKSNLRMSESCCARYAVKRAASAPSITRWS